MDWVLWIRHLRRLAVAKEIHGSQMRGFFPRGAKKLAELNLKDANMRMETCFDNNGSFNFDDAAVMDRMSKEFRDIVIDPADWNPDLEPPAPQDQVVSTDDTDDEAGDELDAGGAVEYDEEDGESD